MAEDASERTPAPEEDSPAGPDIGPEHFHIWKPRPLLRAIQWLPVPRAARAERQGAYELFVMQQALADMLDHVWSAAADEEPFGYLVGDLCEDPDAGVRYVIVSGVLRSRLPFAEGSATQISPEARVALQLEVDRRRGTLAGWYHRHREGAVTLSERDAETHERLFRESWHAAVLVVTDPADPRGGVFQRTPRGLSPATLHPFYELVGTESMRGRGVRRSLLDWTNVETPDAVVREPPSRGAHPAAPQGTAPSREPVRPETGAPRGKEAAERSAAAHDGARNAAEEAKAREAAERRAREAAEEAKAREARDGAERARRVAAEEAKGREAAETRAREATEEAKAREAREAAEQARREAAEQARREAAERTRREAAERTAARRAEEEAAARTAARRTKPPASEAGARARAAAPAVETAPALVVTPARRHRRPRLRRAGLAAAGVATAGLLVAGVIAVVRRAGVPEPAAGGAAASPASGGTDAAPAGGASPGLVRLDELARSMTDVLSRYYGVTVAFDAGRGSCADLQAAYVAVEDGWIAYNARGKAPLDAELEGERLTRDRRLYEGVQEIERLFTRTGCPRP